MNSLMLVSVGLLAILGLVFFVVYFASLAARDSKRADYAEKDLKLIKRFQIEMSRPLAVGSDLVKRMRSRIHLP